MPFTDIKPDDADVGITRQQLAIAVSTWAWMQERRVTVADAMTAFNTTAEIIRQAVDDGAWTFLEIEGDGPTHEFIEQDGE